MDYNYFLPFLEHNIGSSISLIFMLPSCRFYKMAPQDSAAGSCLLQDITKQKAPQIRNYIFQK